MLTKFAVVVPTGDVGLGEIRSTHYSEAAAARRLPDVPGAYIAHRRPDGLWETRLEARERRERAPAPIESPRQGSAAVFRLCVDAVALTPADFEAATSEQLEHFEAELYNALVAAVLHLEARNPQYVSVLAEHCAKAITAS